MCAHFECVNKTRNGKIVFVIVVHWKFEYVAGEFEKYALLNEKLKCEA